MSTKRFLRISWHFLVAAAVLAAAWRFIDFREMLATLASVRIEWLLALLALATADRFLMAAKWLHLLRFVGSTAPFGTALNAYYQSAFMHRFFPSSLGGDALRAVIVSGRHGGTPGVLATMAVEKLLAMPASALIASFGALLILAESRPWALDVLLIGIPVLLVSILVLLRLSFHPPLMAWIIARIPGDFVRRGLTSIYADYERFRRAPRTLAVNFLLSLAEQLLAVVLMLGCALALDVQASVPTLVAGIAIAQCVRKFATLLEGWLFSEFTAVLTYTLVGVPQTQALAFSLLGHAISIAAAIPGGMLFARSASSLKEVRGLLRRPAAGAPALKDGG